MEPVEARQEGHALKPAAAARGYWRWSKEDFFPEPSFGSWGAYRGALAATPARLMDRLIAGRSTDAAELGDMRRRSENEMRRCLTWWDLTWLGFGCHLGAGIFVLTGLESRDHAGPAVVLSYVVAGVSAMLSVLCYAEFAVEIPVAGGSFAYLRVELGDVAAFVAAANLILERHGRGGARLDVVPRVALQQAGQRVPDARAVGRRRGSSRVNWVASAVHLLVLAFIIVAGFLHAKPSNLTPFVPYGVPGVFRATAVVYFAYGGFDSIANMAEETKNPSRDIPLGLIGSMSVITAIYCTMALVLSMLQPYTAIDRNAAFSVAFGAVEMRWMKYVEAVGALKGMTTVLLVGALGNARYATHIARSHIIPPVFALVHPRTGTPVRASTLITAASACVALISSLDVLASLLSISTLFIFVMMAVALLVRRYHARGVTSPAHGRRLVTLLLAIVGSSAGIAACWGAAPERWAGYAALVPVWAAATLGIQLLVPVARAPRRWGVPLVPWLPSLSIATNFFLMGSLGAQAFVRFGVCTAVMMLYYVLVGLHATYDVAHDGAGEERADHGDAAGDEKAAVAVAATHVEKSGGDGGQ
ncbi:hypothetical protein ACQ4PT_032399 [Festuca glaucescens]